MEDVHTKFQQQVRGAVRAINRCSTGDFASSCREAARIKDVWMAPPHEEERRAKASKVFGFDFPRQTTVANGFAPPGPRWGEPDVMWAWTSLPRKDIVPQLACSHITPSLLDEKTCDLYCGTTPVSRCSYEYSFETRTCELAWECGEPSSQEDFPSVEEGSSGWGKDWSDFIPFVSDVGFQNATLETAAQFGCDRLVRSRFIFSPTTGCQNHADLFCSAYRLLAGSRWDFIEWFDMTGSMFGNAFLGHILGTTPTLFNCGRASSLCVWFNVYGMGFPPGILLCQWYLQGLQTAWDASPSGSDDRTCLALDLAAVIAHETFHLVGHPSETMALSIESWFRMRAATRLGLYGQGFCCPQGIPANGRYSDLATATTGTNEANNCHTPRW